MSVRPERVRGWVAKVVGLGLVFAAGCTPRAALAPSTAWPTAPWSSAAPEALGIDSVALSNMLRVIETSGLRMHHVYIARHGRTVLDAAMHPSAAGQTHRVDHITGVVTATLYGVALQRGLVPPVNTRVTDAFALPERPNDIAWSALTIDDLLNMRTGLVFDDSAEAAPQDNACAAPDITAWLPQALGLRGDTIPGVQLEPLPLATQLLGALIENGTGTSLAEFAQSALFAPLGMESATWHTQSGTTDAISGLSLVPADLARLGTLFLSGGYLNGQQLLPLDWMADANAAENPYLSSLPYVQHWHVWDDDVLAGVGRGGQYWIVDRMRDMVVVLYAGESADRIAEVEALWHDRIVPAVSDTPRVANRMAAEALQNRVRRMAITPVTGPASTRPATARAYDARWYVLEPNAIDIARVSFDVLDPIGAILADWITTRARIRFGFAGALERTDGLSDVLPFGPSIAAAGRWEGANTLLLEVDTVSNIERWEVRVEFGEGVVTIHADPTLLRSPLDPTSCLLLGTPNER